MKRFSVFLVIALGFLVTSAFAGPVSHFGALKVCGKNICGEKTGTSTPVFFKGPSLYWSDGSGTPFYNLETVDWFVDNMQIGIIRAPMGIRYYKEGSEEVNKAGGIAGYYFNKATQKSYIKKVIDAAIANDIYVIVDWHSHDAHKETNDAKDFFVEMAKEYKDVPNIIWEVYNEPVSASLDQITTHANTIITALRGTGVNNNNLVIIGSPQWSKQPQQQAGNWGSSRDKNVAFTFHFYAGTHPFTGEIGTSAKGAMNAGYAVFGSEWGSVNADGKGSVNSGATDSWTSWMDSEKISNCMWDASSLDEGASIFTTGTGIANLSTSRLTASGTYFQTYMGKNKWTAQIPANHPKGNNVTFEVRDGETATFTATQLGVTGNITDVSSRESFSVEASNTANSITYKADGTRKAKIVLIYKVTQNSITIQNKITVNITNRLLILPEIDPIPVSRKTSTTLNIVNNLSASDPSGKTLQLTAASVSPTSAGTVTTSGNNIVFTPATSLHNTEGTEATLSYTVSNGSNSKTASVVLQIQNFAPEIRSITSTFSPQVPNTDPVGIGMDRFSGKDIDGDAISFDKIYLDPQYPGRLERVEGRSDSAVYYPDAGKTGKVTFLAVITDGIAFSPTGRANITLTGDGSPIGDLPVPTQIPDVIDPPLPIISQLPKSGGLGIKSLGKNIEVYFSQSGNAKLDVYSLSGENMGNLLNGHQNAGSKEVSLRGLNLQKGVYILRLSQGSQVKILRVVN